MIAEPRHIQGETKNRPALLWVVFFFWHQGLILTLLHFRALDLGLPREEPHLLKNNDLANTKQRNRCLNKASVYIYIYTHIYIYIYIDWGSIPGQVIPKTHIKDSKNGT